MSDEIVREQLAKTIKAKEVTIRSNRRAEREGLEKAELFGGKADEGQIEVDALRDHLDTLGGPLIKGEG